MQKEKQPDFLWVPLREGKCLLVTFSPPAAEHVMKDRTAAQTSAAGGLRGDKSTLLEEERRWILEGELYLEQGEISNMLSSAAAAGCGSDWRQRCSPGRRRLTSWMSSFKWP